MRRSISSPSSSSVFLSVPGMPDEPIVEIFKKLNASPLRKHATEVGMISVLWTRLELYLDVLLLPLLNADEHTASVLITGMGLREKIRTIELLGFKKSPSDDWFERLSKCLKTINEKLRPLRNRYIHDYWLSSSESIVRLQHNTKLVRPQSRQFAIQYHEAKETKIGELMAFQVQILFEISNLVGLIGDLYASDVPTPSYDTD